MRITRRLAAALVRGSLAAAIALVPAAAVFAGAPPAPPTLTKAFSPPSINEGGSTVLTFTIANPTGAPPLTTVGFVDTLPSGLAVANGSIGGTCVNAAAATSATAGGNTITVTALQVPAGESTCTVTVNVTNAADQTNESCSADPAAFTNGSANVSVTNVVNGISPTCLVVHATEPPPPAPVVPVLSPGMLLLLATALAGVGIGILRRFAG